jgi:hypothetical protein
MSVIVSCPKCQRKLKIEDSALGKQIKCPGCAAIFATKAPAGAVPPPAPKAAAPTVKTAPVAAPKKPAPPPPDDDEDEAPRRPAKAARRDDDDEDDRPAKKPAAKARDEDDEDDDRPAKKPAAKAPRDDYDDDDDRPAKKPAAKAPRDDDEDDDRPAKKPAAKKGRDDDDEYDDRPVKKSAGKKGRASDDDDDDDRPRKKAKKKSSTGMVLAIVGALVLLLCGGCGGLGYYFVYKANEAGNSLLGAMTDAAAKMQTDPAFRPPPDKPGPGVPGADTKKTAGGPGDKPGGGKPGKPEISVTAEALARDLLTNDKINFPMYGSGRLLEVEGTVGDLSKGPDGSITEVVFKPEIIEGGRRGGAKHVVPVWCRLTTPLPASKAADVAVGKKIHVFGKLTGWDPNGKQATLNECSLAP